VGIVADFERELRKKAGGKFASWRRVDLHNHSPNSHDYRGNHEVAIEKSAERIRETNLSIVMFCDHAVLPDPAFVSAVEKKTGSLILRGVELNVFLDAWDKEEEKVSKNLFYHVLVGFDPNASEPPEYWLTKIYRECKAEERDCGSIKLKGITSPIDKLCEELEGSNAIVIPAHLHSERDAFKSRSIDDIYADQEFLRHAKEHFTALEVKSESTAAFFDGQHEETGFLERTCIWSSDSHEPETLGARPCYVQVENKEYGELKAALELPFRTSLNEPTEPASHVVGLHIQGQFFPDLWLAFSPHCNVLMGVKGSGKTSVLECIRFVLGKDVPETRAEDVNEHLNAILGDAGKVRVLLKRADGGKILVERAISHRDQFKVTFDDDRVETFTNPEALQMNAAVLGWHEIEQAATDEHIRRLYMDSIAGRERIRTLEEEASAFAKQIRHKHDQASNRYGQFQDLHKQVCRLEERRKGLQELKEANLIELRNQYEASTKHREQFLLALKVLRESKDEVASRVESVLSALDRNVFGEESPLDAAVTKAREVVDGLFCSVDAFGTDLTEKIASSIPEVEQLQKQADDLFNSFSKEYDERLATLSPEERQLLESHRKVMEETKALTRLESERAESRKETEEILRDLVNLCENVVERINGRTALREQKVAEFDGEVKPYGVSLSVIRQNPAGELGELQKRYTEGAKVFGELQSRESDEHLHHRRLKREYERLLGNLAEGKTLFFQYAEFGYFLSIFENDDLDIGLAVGKTGEEYSKIDKLSAGQRCTAIFPLLLKLREGPLVVDQPEDNLDNRHIADKIAPALLNDKRSRQIILTSHNANLVVLSDAEMIVAFEGTGSEGRIEEQGFLATRDSRITTHVLEILDGGERALELRYRKYGSVK
jgi:predicted ATP-dependent endonuclease of OLD family